jgi:tetratricopeptide (TPR) repeat protein
MATEIPEEFRSFAERAILEWMPEGRYHVIRVLAGGKSGAVVLHIDLAPRLNVGGSESPILASGQYILKVQEHRSWGATEPSEKERHLAAVVANSEFTDGHIPPLVRDYAVDSEGGNTTIALLYDIAGASLIDYQTAYLSNFDSLRQVGKQVMIDLLKDWNHRAVARHGVSAGEQLQSWLGYRLDPARAPRLHQYINKNLDGDSVFMMGHQCFVNPLWLCTAAEIIEETGNEVGLDGLIHGDFHPGNLLLHVQNSKDHPYWIIDFALSREAPLGYDHAYFELALLLRHLQGKDPKRILEVLGAIEAPGSEPVRLAPQDLGLVSCIRDFREAFERWRKETEIASRRADSCERQMLLARVAVALNWVNKPAEEDDHRGLAFAYGAWAARAYLMRFHAKLWDELGDQAGPSSIAPPVAVEPPKPDAKAQKILAQFWEAAGQFDASRARYVLISGPSCQGAAFASLGLLPWSVVVDLDPVSEMEGLYSQAATALSKIRSLRPFGKESAQTDFDRGTSWMMAGGWPNRFEPAPPNLTEWRRQYLPKIRTLWEEFRRVVAPQPIKVIVFVEGGDPDRLDHLLNTADEVFQDLAEIILLGKDNRVGRGVSATRLQLSPALMAAEVGRIFGTSLEVPEPQVPGPEGTFVTLPIERLRWMEEDFDVLHTRILNDSPGPQDQFWRGLTPTWSDLDQAADIPRSIHTPLVDRLKSTLEESRNYTLPIYHHPGAGGTTVSLRAAWSLRQSYPATVLRRYSENTFERLDTLFHIAQRPVLLVAEASLLPPAERERLYVRLIERNARVVILYVVRTTQPEFNEARTLPEQPEDGSTPGAETRPRFVVADPLDDGEANEFLKEYRRRTTDPDRKLELKNISEKPDRIRYRLPFFYGLITYQQDFQKLDHYVRVHVVEAKHSVRRIMMFLALVTRFSQTGLHSVLVNRLLNLQPGAKLNLEEILGAGPSRLVIRVENRLKLMHPLFAEELLRQGLGESEAGIDKDELRDLSIDLIQQVVRILGANVDESLHLLTQLFITRSKTSEVGSNSSDFAELIEKMTDAGGHQVLQELTEVCPGQAHFWNHLGRHHIYRMKLDFKQAEEYLEKATLLGKNDPLHYHTLGMVRRFWIERDLDRLLEGQKPPTPGQILETVGGLQELAAGNFASARELAELDEHGYITHIQMILRIAETMKRASKSDDFGGLSSTGDKVGRWLRENISIAESLLERIKQMRGQSRASDHEIRCTQKLSQLCDNFESVIKAWEIALNREPTDTRFRRALAYAYYARRQRAWGELSEAELRRIVELVEYNIQRDPSNDSDLRMWFQAYRRLPSFDLLLVLSRLQSWAARTNAIDSHYYLYIIHYLNFRNGNEVDDSLAEQSLRRCKDLAKGKRSGSHEWLSIGPEWCPLAHFSELGKWDQKRRFWTDTQVLESVTGVICPFDNPQSGSIRVSQKLTAFFVPGEKFRSVDVSKIVHFYLGFSYDGLRAWQVEFGSAPNVQPPHSAPKHESKLALANGAVDGVGEVEWEAGWDEVDDPVLRKSVHGFIRDLVTAGEGTGQVSTPDDVERRVLSAYYGDPVHLQFGYDDFRGMLGEVDGIRLVDRDGLEIVQLADPLPAPPDTPAPLPQGSVVSNVPKTSQPTSVTPKPKFTPIVPVEFDLDKLRELAITYLQGQVYEGGPKGVNFEKLETLMAARFIGQSVAQRLGHSTFRDFIGTIPKLRMQVVGSREAVVWAEFPVSTPSVAATIAPSKINEDDLRDRVIAEIFKFIDERAVDGRDCVMADIGHHLGQEFPGPVKIHKRLEHQKLLGFLESIEGLEVVNLMLGKDLVRRVVKPLG